MNKRERRLIRLDDSQRILSKAECDVISRRIASFAKDGGETRARIHSWWNGEVRWGRNRVTLASDRRDIRVDVTRLVHGSEAGASTNQLDDESLEATVRAAERSAAASARVSPGHALELPKPSLTTPRTTIWSDATYALTAAARGEVARTLVDAAETKGIHSAGYLEVRGGSTSGVLDGETHYAAYTQAQCSMTVRDTSGTGSGWAGLSSYDWGRIGAPALAERAIEKCLASRNPVALEPGRYTVILEPQAVADLMQVLVGNMDRFRPERFEGRAFSRSPRRTKLGLKVVDSRITVSHDPSDPELGIIPSPGMQPLTWIDRGVLTALSYDRGYALGSLREHVGVRSPIGYRMSGGDTSTEEMIRTTKRGLLVTRFSNVREIDPESLVSRGLTRDGLWLIENGKISKAVKNFRFTESPLFVLNSIEQLGVPVPVFRPVTRPDVAGLTPAIVPPLKARDFSFTSMIDAV
jgi:predicted Zn-dependent protease